MIRELVGFFSLQKKGFIYSHFRNGYPFPFQSAWLNRLSFSRETEKKIVLLLFDRRLK